MGTARENSSALLVALYQATGGQMHTRSVNYTALGESIGLNRDESRAAATRLSENGLAKPLGMGSIALTPEGKGVAEETALSPAERNANEATARKVLRALYTATGGNTNSGVLFVETAATVGVERDAAVNLFDDFINRGWVRSFGTGRRVLLTNDGVDVVEELG